jgi:excinuclease UvrABC nuclease subunit
MLGRKRGNAMVDINFNLTISNTGYDEIPDRQPGLYLLFGEDGLLYIGKSINLRDRVKLHLIGNSEKSMFSYLFTNCSLLYETDKKKRDDLERELIAQYLPVLNLDTVGCTCSWKDRKKNEEYVRLFNKGLEIAAARRFARWGR